jgi:hypothetical protein
MGMLCTKTSRPGTQVMNIGKAMERTSIFIARQAFDASTPEDILDRGTN